jgi:hypothetical protein
LVFLGKKLIKSGKKYTIFTHTFPKLKMAEGEGFEPSGAALCNPN